MILDRCVGLPKCLVASGLWASRKASLFRAPCTRGRSPAIRYVLNTTHKEHGRGWVRELGLRNGLRPHVTAGETLSSTSSGGGRSKGLATTGIWERILSLLWPIASYNYESLNVAIVAWAVAEASSLDKRHNFMPTSNTDASANAAVDMYEALLRAWNDRNAGAFARLFGNGATAVGFDGSEMTGPSEIESQLSAIFTSHPTAAYVAKVREVRRLGDGILLLRGAAGMRPPGKSELMPDRNAIQTLIVVTESGTWRIAHFQNTPARFDGRSELVKEMTAELTAVLRAGTVVHRRPPSL